MTTFSQASMSYEIDRREKSQPIIVKHTEDRSSGLPVLLGLAAYVAMLPALFAALMLPDLLF